jgi:hypothetical protein
MSMLPQLLGGEGTPLSIEFRGKTYTFQPITFGLMEKMEALHLDQAKARLRAMKDVLDEDTYTKKALDLYMRYEAGEFGFLSAAGQQWLKTPSGAACLLKLTLGINDAELFPLIVARGEEIKQLLEVVLREAGLSSKAESSARGGEGRAEAPFPSGS